MKKCLFVVICVLFISLSVTSTNISAEEIDSGICGIAVTWNFDSNGTLTISGTGDMLCNKDLYDSDESESFAIYVDETIYGYDKYIDDIKTVIIEEGVTSVGPEAFWSANNLSLVYLPSTLTKVHSSAFGSCESITAVYHPDLTIWCNIIFENCDSNPLNPGAKLYINNNLLTSLSIPQSITKINAYSFYGCSSIQSVYIGEGVTAIDDWAFKDCALLELITIPKSMEYIGIFAFSKTDKVLKVYIDDLITWCNIDFAVYGNPLICNGELYADGSLLTNITLPDTIQSLKRHTFQGYELLQTVIIPEGITSIDHGAFYECSGLKTVSLPKSLSKIEGYAFEECSSLTSITIPEGITDIKYRTFYNCTDLKAANLPDSITSIGDSAFYNCSSLLSVNMKNVLSVDSSAFSYCSSLAEVSIPKVANIPTKAFMCCSNLAKINMPSVTAIGYGSFAYCNTLDKINLSSVVSIDEYAFLNCENLTCVYIPQTVTSISKKAFNTLEIVYYSGSESDWVTFTSANELTSMFKDIKVYFTVSSESFDSFANPYVEYSSDAECITIVPYMLPKHSTIILRYENQGHFTIQTITYSGSKEITVPVSVPYDNLKIIIWDSLESMIPIT